MGKKSELNKEEKSPIVKRMNKGKSTNDKAKKLQRYHQTIKRSVRKSQDRSTPRVEWASQIFWSQELSSVKWVVAKRPLANSKIFFFSAVALKDAPRSTHCWTLRRMAKDQRAKKRPQLKKIHQEKLLEWATQHMSYQMDQMCGHLAGYEVAMQLQLNRAIDKAVVSCSGLPLLMMKMLILSEFRMV